MARKSITDITSENTANIYNDLMEDINNASTTDLFIKNNYEMPVGLTTGEKVAIGFGIAGGAIVLGYIIYKGIAYVVTQSKNKKTGEEKVDVKPVENPKEVPVNIPEVSTQQQPVIVPTTGTPEEISQMIPLLQQTTQAVVNTANIIATTDQKLAEVDQSMANIKQNQDKLVETINRIANTNSTLQNQFDTAIKNSELSDAMLNYMIGMYNNLARQTGTKEVTGAELVRMATGQTQPQPQHQVMSPIYDINQQPIIYGPNGQPMPAPSPIQ